MDDIFSLDVTYSNAGRWAAFSPNGKWMETESRGGVFKLFDFHSRQFIHKEQCNSTVLFVKFSSNSEFLVVGLKDGSLHFMDVESKQFVHVIR